MHVCWEILKLLVINRRKPRRRKNNKQTKNCCCCCWCSMRSLWMDRERNKRMLKDFKTRVLKYITFTLKYITWRWRDCSHCVFSKHIRPKSFFKTYIQQTNLQTTNYITKHIQQTTIKLKKWWGVIVSYLPWCPCAILAQNHPAKSAEPWVALVASESCVGIDISVLHELQKINKCFRCLISRTFL